MGIFMIIKRKVMVSKNSQLIGKDAIFAGIFLIIFGAIQTRVLTSDSLYIVVGTYVGFIAILALFVFFRRKPFVTNK
jgi:hypothetical protein